MIKKDNLLTIAGLLIYALVVIAPLLIHGYVYPNVGDDTSVYLERIENMGKGLVSVQYTGYSIVGYPMLFLRDMLGWSLNTQFLWVNFTALILIGWVIYFVFSRLVNRLTGWLALILTLFVSQGIWYLFYYGQIFNVVNVGIILPLVFYFTAKYLRSNKWYYLLLTISLAALFSTFHANGIYIPAIAALGTLVYVIYCRVKKQLILKRAIYLGGGITALTIMGFTLLVVLPTLDVIAEYEQIPFMEVVNNIGKGLLVPVNSWLMTILSPSILILVGVIAFYTSDIKKSLTDDKTKIFLYLLVVLAFMLVIVSFARLSLDPWRQAVDLSIIVSFGVAVGIGLLLSKQKKNVLIILGLVIAFGFYHNLPTWFSFNSAIRQVDLQAIEYLNNVKTFSCSSQVAPWVYMRYTNAKHKDNDGDIVIMRNRPMTPRSDETNMWYQSHGWQPSFEYELTATFDDGYIKIEVYTLSDWAREERKRLMELK